MALRRKRYDVRSVTLGDTLTIDTPEQLKALSHRLRLRVLDLLSESDDAMTNRELAQRLSVDPGQLHFHVRMLLAAGLIERAPGPDGREKPYRAVASSIRVAPELLGTSAAMDAQRAMLDEVTRGYAQHADDGRWRSAQITARVPTERLRDCVDRFLEELSRSDDAAADELVVTVIAHPHVAESELTAEPGSGSS